MEAVCVEWVWVRLCLVVGGASLQEEAGAKVF